MPNLSPKAIEAGAKAVRRHHAWSCFWSFDDAKQLVETGITAAIEADGMAERGWQPIETAPKDGSSVLVANSVSVSEAHWCEDPGGWWQAQSDPTDHYDGQMHPTHWMPLPAPPAGQEG